MSFFPIDKPSQLAQQAKKYRGVWLGTVMENKDTPPDNPGYRIKITIPHLSEDEKTFWARIAVPMGGKGRGTYHLPEKDDQLLVVFEHGDLHKPIIIGALHNKKQMPPETNDSGKNNTKLIKSRSGHRFIFDDKEGSEKVTIVDSKQNQIILDSANKVVKIISKTGDIEVKAKQNVIFHANALKVGTTEGIKTNGKMVLTHAASTFGIKASSEIVITGSQVQTNVANAPACQVSGSGAGELGAAGAETAKDQVQAQNGAGGGGGGAGEGAAGAAGGGAGGAAAGGGAAGGQVEPTPGPAPSTTTDLPPAGSASASASGGGSGASAQDSSGSVSASGSGSAAAGASGSAGAGAGGASGSAGAGATGSAGAGGAAASGGAAGASGSAGAGAAGSAGASGAVEIW